MTELLKGSVDFLSVEDLLRLLSSQRATGILHIDNPNGEAALHLIDGQLVQAEAKPPLGNGKAESVASDALMWSSGSFVFKDTKPTAAGRPINVSELIERTAKRRAVWKEFREQLPSDSAVLRVVDNPQAQEKITLTREQWKVLARINGERSVGELLDEGEDPIEMMQILHDFLTKKLIEAAAPKKVVDTKPFAVPGEVLAADARPAEPQGPEKTVLGMKLRQPPEDSPRSEPTIACLTLDGPEEQMFALVENEYQIGREPQNAIRLQDSSVSGSHARVFRSAEGYVLEDLNSRNGSFINGERIQRQLLKENDRIRLGKVQLIYNIAGDKPSMSPSTVP